MSDLIDTTEMYLKAILEVIEVGKLPKRSVLSHRLEQAMPTVSQTVERMVREGLVYLDDDRVIHFSEEGQSLATSVMRKHRIAELYLYRELGFAWADCHEEACRWEHVMSDAAEVKMVEKLGLVTSDPYGNSIPGLEAIGLPAAPSAIWPTVSDLHIPSGSPVSATVKAITEPIQTNPAELNQLQQLGIVPDAEILITAVGQDVFLRAINREDSLQLDRGLSDFITVALQ
jgi:DtxR family transcriptional regulator, Mn-dependent transcriptional regulator